VRHRWNTAKVRLGKAADDEFTPHCCRHTFASWLVQAGVPIYTVKELCGHKCIEVTMRYAHLSDRSLSSAIEAAFNK
jgi:integrase